MKVLRKDWRFGEEWWVNKVGTYCMASAQSYWGRLAALLLRVLWTGTLSSSTTSCGCFEARGERGGGIASHSPGIGHPTQLEEDALGGG